jgi:hypothetical protein
MLDGRVAAYLAEHLDASANEVVRELRRRRRDVLAAVRRTRANGNRPHGS